MTASDTLAHWRIASDLSVVHAAILVAGGDPSTTETEPVSYSEGNPKDRNTNGSHASNVVFTAMTTAILRGKLPATLSYPIADYYVPIDRVGTNTRLLTKHDLSKFLQDDERFRENNQLAIVELEPDWLRTTVDVDDLKTWLCSRGVTTGFFFPEHKNADDADAFMDVNHDHFSPDVALAISAWRALSNEQRFPRGVKAAIEDWIDAHPEAWKGEDSLSQSAKERIATLVNWKRTGGAPRIGT